MFILPSRFNLLKNLNYKTNSQINLIQLLIISITLALTSSHVLAHHKETHKENDVNTPVINPITSPFIPKSIKDLLAENHLTSENIVAIAKIIDENPLQFQQIIVALATYYPQQLPAILSQFTGEVGFSSRLGGVNQGNRFISAISQGRENRVLLGSLSRQMNGDGKTVAVNNEKLIYAWTTFSAAQLNQNGSAFLGNANSSVSPYGAAMGLEYVIDRTKLIGFALYGGGMRYDAQGLGAGKGVNSLFSLYGRYGFGDNYALMGTLITGFQENENTRSIKFGGITENLGSKASAHSLGGRLEISKTHYTSYFTSTPFAALQTNILFNKAYHEIGLNGSSTLSALSYDSSKSQSIRSEFGVNLEKSFDSIHRISAKFGWGHEYAGAMSQTARFLIAPTASFTLASSTPSRNMLLLGLGGETRIGKNATFNANLAAEFSQTSRSYGGQVGFKWQW